MTDIVERAKTALDGTTDGPWDVVPGAWGNVWHVSDDPGSPPLIVRMGGMKQPDAEFIAEARTLVPELVAEVESLRDDLRFYREWSNDLTQYIPEEFDDDIAQEAIISHWASFVSSEVKRLRAAIGRAKAVLLELETEMQPHIDAFVSGPPDITEVSAAASRVVGARRVLAALEASDD
ncbi:hypothetical protein [Mycolicibacterium peregrinum]|uniref:hypothetical protein n=1 Tax=Mycolicibacterium peregrinum TaxID=43304 RepID=UPI003AAADE36